MEKNYDSKMIQKVFLHLLPVQILIAAVSSINGIIDATVASNVIGAEAIAATGLFFPITKILDTLNVVLLGGAQILCGKMLGKNQVDRTQGIFSVDMLVVAVISIVMTLASVIFAGPIAGLLGASNIIKKELADYIVGMAPGFFAYMVVAQLASFLQLERQEKRTYLGIVVMAVVNITLDLAFVAGLHMGMFGLGLATSISNWVYLIFLASYYFTSNAIIKFSIKSIDFKDIIEIVRIGTPGAVTQFGQVVRGVILNYIFLWFVGDNGVASYAAVCSFGGIFFAINSGISAATRLLISVYVGEKDRTGLNIIIRTAIAKGVMLNILMCVICVAFSNQMAMIFYSRDAAELFSMTRLGFIMFPISMIFTCIYIVLSNYYQSLGRIKYVNTLSIFDGGVGMIVSALALAPAIGMVGIWLSQILNGVYVVLIIFVYAFVWNKHMPKTVDDFMILGDEFGVNDSDRLDISVHDMSKVVEASVEVCDFCKNHNVNPTHITYAGLCVEEAAGNIIEHGFTDGKQHSIDIRVVYVEGASSVDGDSKGVGDGDAGGVGGLKGAGDGDGGENSRGELLIRFKDDGRPFNPRERAEMLEPTDVTHNIGLRIMSKTAKEMLYQNTFGLNVLTVRI